MRQFDILAQWLRENPLPFATPYHEIRESARRATGITPSNRTLPTVLRDAGYFRIPTTYGTWYGRADHAPPAIKDQAWEFFVGRR